MEDTGGKTRAARVEQVSLACSIALLTLGAMGLLGWLPGLAWLGKLRAGYIPMAPATGAVFLLLGTVFCLRRVLSLRDLGHALTAAGVVAALTGAAVLLQLVLGLDTDFERYLLPGDALFGAVKLARMSPLAGVNFVLDGAAVALLGRSLAGGAGAVSRSVAGVLASIAAGVTSTVLLGYFFDTPLFYGTKVIPMALTTASAFLALDGTIIATVGADHLPLRPFVGAATRARLLRTFLPISFVTIVVNGFLLKIVNTHAADVNYALFSALSAMLGAAVTAVVVVYAARVISHDIDTATQAKIHAELEARRLENEKHKAETLLIHAYKMSALGEMAGNIAHEINNPLAIIDGKSKQLYELLEREGEGLDKAKRFSKAISETSLRLVKIVNGLRTMSRVGDRDPFERKSVADLVEETVALCIAKFKLHEVKVDVGLIAADLEIECRPTEISQVLMNLISNAHDAVEHLDERWIKIDAAEAEPQWISIAVTDSGRGIPAEVKKRMLEPFFTTKAVGKGTGLGLSISANFIIAHGGSLLIDDASPHTRFIVRLPRRQLAPVRHVSSGET